MKYTVMLSVYHVRVRIQFSRWEPILSLGRMKALPFSIHCIFYDKAAAIQLVIVEDKNGARGKTFWVLPLPLIIRQNWFGRGYDKQHFITVSVHQFLFANDARICTECVRLQKLATATNLNIINISCNDMKTLRWDGGICCRRIRNSHSNSFVFISYFDTHSAAFHVKYPNMCK